MHPAAGVGGSERGFCCVLSVCRSERNGCVTRCVLRSRDKNLLDRQTGEAEDDPVERRSQCTFSLMIPCIEVFVMLSDTESDQRWVFLGLACETRATRD